MKGKGTSYGAVTVMNAIPCGIGSTIGIGLKTKATFTDAERQTVHLVDRPKVGQTLVRTCVMRTREKIGQPVSDGYHLEVRTDIPPSMGLKSSSSVCNAVIDAVLNAYGETMEPLDIIRLGVECAKECKVTITGAFDDACGCGLGGLVVTDNSKNELLLRKRVPDYDIVVCIPNRRIPKSRVPVDEYRKLRENYEAMVPKIEDDYLSVLTENGRYVEGLIGRRTGLAGRALKLGALAAGITGTGPATAVIAEKGDGQRIADELNCRTVITRTRW